MATPTLGAMIAAIGSPTAEWGAVATTKLYWDDVNGRWGIGTNTPGSILDVKGNGNVLNLTNASDLAIYQRFVRPSTTWYLASDLDNNGGKDFAIYSASADTSFDIYTAGYHRFKITAAGYVGIGTSTSTPAYILTCNGQPGANGYTAWTNYSDEKFKKDVTGIDAKSSLDKILSLRPVSFKYNQKYADVAQYELDDKEKTGFIAQELQTIFPEMVGSKTLKDKDGSESDYLDSNLTGLDIHLVNAIKELNTNIENLKKKSFADPNTWK